MDDTALPLAQLGQHLITEVQALGLRLEDPQAGAAARRGGAGPTDHKAVTLAGRTVMVPVHSNAAKASPFLARTPDAHGVSVLERNGLAVAKLELSLIHI